MSEHLETAAGWWLMEARCLLVMTERTPFFHRGRPDVIGVTMARHVVEIECKRTVADFKADMKKPHIANTEWNLEREPQLCPRRFYYCVPEGLVAAVRDLTPAWAGLLYVRNQCCFCAKPARVNQRARKLKLKALAHAVQLQTRELVMGRMGQARAMCVGWGRDPLGWDEWHSFNNEKYENWVI